MKKYITALLLAITFIPLPAFAGERNEDCLAWTEKEVNVTGLLYEATYPGKVNFPEKYWFLKPDTPICGYEKIKDGLSIYVNVRRETGSIQVALDGYKYLRYKPLLNKKVDVTGFLHATWNPIFHHARAQILVEKMVLHDKEEPRGKDNAAAPESNRAYIHKETTRPEPADETKPEECLEYGPVVVHIKGTLKKRMYPGPENEGDILEGERPYSYWALEPVKPICVWAPPDVEDVDSTEYNVNALHLVVHKHDVYDKHRNKLSEKVIITGQLFHSHTMHHRTRVLIEVENIKSVKHNK